MASFLLGLIVGALVTTFAVCRWFAELARDEGCCVAARTMARTAGLPEWHEEVDRG